ncbi:MAG TPA: GNAT family N-acetyltransferase, partial [Candidatus Nanopelagicales bacterium]|nr:GNAT family N-acetyltransferase [Candidatus Nanopelagicales bacterium]
MIRPARPEDCAAMAAVYAPYVEGTWISFEEVAPDAAELARRMAAQPLLPWLLAEEDGAVVGYAYASHHRARPAYRWSVDVSVYLAAAAVGRGLGTGLYGALLPLLRDLGYVSAYAGVAEPNPASTALHARLGFTPVGTFRDVGFKLGGWRDVTWHHLRLDEPP